MSDFDLVARANALRRRVETITREQSPAERDALAAAQVRADSVGAFFGERVSSPLPGETALAYRKRILVPFAKRHRQFADSRFDSMDTATLDIIEPMIHRDLVASAQRPEAHQPGTLHSVTTHEGGRDITRFYGDIASWMAPLMSSGAVCMVNRNPVPRS